MTTCSRSIWMFPVEEERRRCAKTMWKPCEAIVVFIVCVLLRNNIFLEIKATRITFDYISNKYPREVLGLETLAAHKAFKRTRYLNGSFVAVLAIRAICDMGVQVQAVGVWSR